MYSNLLLKGREVSNDTPKELRSFGKTSMFDGDQLDILFLLDRQLVPKFNAFHYSCLTDRINEKVSLDILSWSDVALGRMTE